MKRVLLFTSAAGITPAYQKELLSNGVIPVRVKDLTQARLLEMDYASVVLESAMEALSAGQNDYANREFVKRLRAKIGAAIKKDVGDG